MRVTGPSATHNTRPGASNNRVSEAAMEDRKREGYF